MRPKRILPFLLVLLLWGHGAFGWSFGVCGDSRDDNNGVLPRILAAVETSDMEFLIHTGDLAPPPKGTTGIRYLVVAMHIPPRTDNIFPHGTAKNYDTQSDRLRKILERREVDLLLCSHEHMNQVDEWGGTKGIGSGGAGAR